MFNRKVWVTFPSFRSPSFWQCFGYSSTNSYQKPKIEHLRTYLRLGSHVTVMAMWTLRQASIPQQKTRGSWEVHRHKNTEIRCLIYRVVFFFILYFTFSYCRYFRETISAFSKQFWKSSYKTYIHDYELLFGFTIICSFM